MIREMAGIVIKEIPLNGIRLRALKSDQEEHIQVSDIFAPVGGLGALCIENEHELRICLAAALGLTPRVATTILHMTGYLG
jgi:hypothetical protein